MRTVWYFLLLSTICLEGLGRKYLPAIPSVAFYFAKDVVLLFGYQLFRPQPIIGRTSRLLYGGFKIAWILGFFWTLGELVNPHQASYLLGVIGLRSYWLWWFLAPPVIASALQDEKQKRRAVYSLLIMATGISILAALQFASPPDSALNVYSVVEGEEVHAEQVMVDSTPYARVSSTFSYISGFSDFTMLVPTLLLSIGLDAKDRKLRRLALIATSLSAAVVPMAGSRASIVTGTVILLITAWTAGLFATQIGRRVILGGIVAAIVAVVVFPDAFLGVRGRFGSDTDETAERLRTGAANVVPPLALATFDYPPLGIGTGMMQNARAALNIETLWDTELEAARCLVELGPAGYLVLWTARLGLAVALFRAFTILKRAGRRGASAAALSYLFLTLQGNIIFDHIFQALYFMGCGFILAEVVAAVRAANERVVPSNAVSSVAPGRVVGQAAGLGIVATE